MEGPSAILVLSQQDLSIPLNNHACILFEDAVGSHIEVAMAANGVSIVVHRAHKMTFVDVQVLELVTFFDVVESGTKLRGKKEQNVISENSTVKV